jgi:hypothetical protein
MAKRFDIQEWIAKQKLAEQDDFTPDLEDDELKRSKIQQMMAKEKIPVGGDEKLRNAVEAIADMYSYGEILDAIESFYIKNDEQKSAEIARKHAKEFRAMLDDEDEDEMFMGDWGPHLAEEDLDEANVTGTGTSISTGNSPAYATPKAFSKNKNKKAPYRKSGYMGYSEPVKENEEEKEYSRDVEALEKLIDDKINTKNEWVDMFQLLMAHSEEIQGLSDSQIKSLLQQSLKDI